MVSYLSSFYNVAGKVEVFMKIKLKIFLVLILALLLNSSSFNAYAYNRYDKLVAPVQLYEKEPNNDIQNANGVPTSVPDILAVSKHDYSVWKRMSGNIDPDDVDVYKAFLPNYRTNYLYLQAKTQMKVEILDINGNVLDEFTLNPLGDYTCVKLDGISGDCYIRLSGASSKSYYTIMVGQVVMISNATFSQPYVLSLNPNKDFSQISFTIDRNNLVKVDLDKPLPKDIIIDNIRIDFSSSNLTGRMPYYSMRTYYSHDWLNSWQRTQAMEYEVDIPVSCNVGFNSLIGVRMECDKKDIYESFSLRPSFKVQYLFYVTDENVECW